MGLELTLDCKKNVRGKRAN